MPGRGLCGGSGDGGSTTGGGVGGSRSATGSPRRTHARTPPPSRDRRGTARTSPRRAIEFAPNPGPAESEPAITFERTVPTLVRIVAITNDVRVGCLSGTMVRHGAGRHSRHELERTVGTSVAAARRRADAAAAAPRQRNRRRPRATAAAPVRGQASCSVGRSRTTRGVHGVVSQRPAAVQQRVPACQSVVPASGQGCDRSGAAGRRRRRSLPRRPGRAGLHRPRSASRPGQRCGRIRSRPASSSRPRHRLPPSPARTRSTCRPVPSSSSANWPARRPGSRS